MAFGKQNAPESVFRSADYLASGACEKLYVSPSRWEDP